MLVVQTILDFRRSELMHRQGTRQSGQQGSKLTDAGENGQGQFGYSVALSADGNTALIGAPEDNNHVGAAWVFARSGTAWQQGPKLIGADESGDGISAGAWRFLAMATPLGRRL